MQSPEYLPAKEALERLSVQAQTLYAYVSRGWIHSISQPGRKARLYLRADVDRMSARAQARAGHGPAAASAMNHGAPIIATEITEITPQGPRYRGHLATELAAAGATFESVAELLWSGHWNTAHEPWAVARPGSATQRVIASLHAAASGERLLQQFALVTISLGMGAPAAEPPQAQPPSQTAAQARHIVATLAGCCGVLGPRRRFMPLRSGESVAAGLMRALGVADSAANRAVIEAILVLLADHELSPGTFSARIAASGGARLHDCIGAALCASAGAQVSQVFDQVDAFVQGAATTERLLARARQLLAHGEAVPGFGHPVYPDGDPRARLMLTMPFGTAPSRRLKAVRGFVEVMERETGLHPRHEFPMVALLRDMGLPRAASSALFVVARVAGWAAHVQEQWRLGQLLRPRALWIAAAPATLHSPINLDAGPAAP